VQSPRLWRSPPSGGPLCAAFLLGESAGARPDSRCADARLRLIAKSTLTLIPNHPRFWIVPACSMLWDRLMLIAYDLLSHYPLWDT
jgi:hypothetical protein